MQLAGTASRTDLKANVKRDRDGSLCIVGIPMVDQGDKGYCAAAVAERILRYYGTEVTQHVIAQMSDTGASSGTDPELMLKVLKRAGVKFGVRMKELKAFNSDEFLARLTRYNSYAKRNKVRPVEVKPVDGVVLVSDLYARMEPKTFRRFMCEEEKRGYKAFLQDVMEYVQQGIPLAWSVELGLFEEPLLRAGPQEGGGHLRIVSGYSPQTREIVYTDSWGAGHESKRMPMDDAWAMTVGLYVFEPRKR